MKYVKLTLNNHNLLFYSELSICWIRANLGPFPLFLILIWATLPTSILIVLDESISMAQFWTYTPYFLLLNIHAAIFQSFKSIKQSI